MSDKCRQAREVRNLRPIFGLPFQFEMLSQKPHTRTPIWGFKFYSRKLR